MSLTYPCELDCWQTPGLCTYYALTSLMVVVLAVTLIWLPFVQLITEINTIVAKVVIYFNCEFLGIKNSYYINNLENLLVSKNFLHILSFFFMSYGLYLASRDFLVSAACYISTLPNTKHMKQLKQLALGIIENLLNSKEQRKCFFKKNPQEIHQESHKVISDKRIKLQKKIRFLLNNETN